LKNKFETSENFLLHFSAVFNPGTTVENPTVVGQMSAELLPVEQKSRRQCPGPLCHLVFEKFLLRINGKQSATTESKILSEKLN
jgi:hypothetical protein